MIPVVGFLESTRRSDEGRAKFRPLSTGMSSGQPHQIPRREGDGQLSNNRWIRGQWKLGWVTRLVAPEILDGRWPIWADRPVPLGGMVMTPTGNCRLSGDSSPGETGPQ